MEAYFEFHRKTFFLITFGVTSLPVPALVAALVHTIRGNRNKVPIVVICGIFASWLFYGAYMYEYAIYNAYQWQGGVCWYLAMNSFASYHWFIAYLYYECASINPFVKHD